MPTAFELLRTFDPAELRGDDGKWTGGAVHEAAKQFEQALKDTEEIGDNVNQSQGTYGDAAFVVHKGTGDVRMVFHDTETGDLREADLSHEEITDLADSLNEVSAHRSEIEAGEGFDDPEDGTPTRVVDYDFGPNREHNVSLWSDGVVKVKLYDDADDDPFELHLHPEDAETGDDLADFVDIADSAAAESAAEDQVNHDFRAARRSDAFEALRAFDPAEIRDPHSGKWTAGAIAHAVLKGHGKSGNLHLTVHEGGETRLSDEHGGVLIHKSDQARTAFGKTNSGLAGQAGNVGDRAHKIEYQNRPEGVFGAARYGVEKTHIAPADAAETDEADPYFRDRVSLHLSAPTGHEDPEALYGTPGHEMTVGDLHSLHDKLQHLKDVSSREDTGSGKVDVTAVGSDYVLSPVDSKTPPLVFDRRSAKAVSNALGAATSAYSESDEADSPQLDSGKAFTKIVKTNLGDVTVTRQGAKGDTWIETDQHAITIGADHLGDFSQAVSAAFDAKAPQGLARVASRSFVSTLGTKAGQTSGGQFALGGGRVTGHGKKVRTSKPKASTAAQKPPSGPRKFSYDPKTGTGVGYGVKGGDPQVRILQADLNRLGLADEGGRTLAVDGRYGPHTTASVRALQASLGLPVTGQVDQALISKVSTLKALPHGVVKPKSPAHPPARTKPRVHAHRSADPYGGDMPSAVATRAPGHFDRTYALDDIQISRSGDGRTVEAYAAIFGQPYEVRDQHGHYMEVIDRAAFNRTLTGGAGRSAMCLYNHGMTVHGTADALSSVPLGTPLEVKPDGRGLLTVTRYNRSALADSVLESIRNGDIRSQSFRGRIIRSSPNTMPRATRSGGLPTITRHELGLTDYGPTPVPVNAGAEIMAVRSVTELIEDFQSLDVDEREELLRALDLSPFAAPDEADVDEDIERATDSPTSDSSGLGAEDPSHPRHSGRLLIARTALLAELRIKGVIRRG